MANAQNQQSNTAEIAVRTSADLAQLAELERILMTDEKVEVVEVIDDPAVMQRAITERLLNATSDEELEQFNALSWTKDLEGVPVVINGFRWRPSDYQDNPESQGPSVFFIAELERLDTGQKVVATTGSRNVLAQLVNLAKRDRIPGAVRMIVPADRKTGRGYTPYWLRTPDGHPGHVDADKATEGAAA